MPSGTPDPGLRARDSWLLCAPAKCPAASPALQSPSSAPVASAASEYNHARQAGNSGHRVSANRGLAQPVPPWNTGGSMPATMRSVGAQFQIVALRFERTSSTGRGSEITDSGRLVDLGTWRHATVDPQCSCYCISCCSEPQAPHDASLVIADREVTHRQPPELEEA
jgi:hypothetical protein